MSRPRMLKVKHCSRGNVQPPIRKMQPSLGLHICKRCYAKDVTDFDVSLQQVAACNGGIPPNNKGACEEGKSTVRRNMCC